MSLIEFTNITKRFPGVLALDGTDLEVIQGGCHALIGENGAPKQALAIPVAAS